MAYDDGLFFVLMFGVDGGPVDTQFLGPVGSSATSANETQWICPIACAVRRIDVIQVVAPGGGETSTYTLRDDGADTTAVVDVVDAAAVANWTGHVNIAADSLLSVRYDESGATATDEVGVIIQLHPFVA